MRRIRWDRVALIVALPIAIGFTNKFTKVYKVAELPTPSEVGVTITEPTENDLEPICDEFESLGEYRISYYCGCEKCNGKWGNISATGKTLEEGMVATDPSIPFGTKLYINTDGVMKEYVVEDRGGAIKGNRIDIYVSDHKVANELGIVYTDVFIKK